MTDDFNVIIESLGNMTVDHVKGQNLGIRQIRIDIDPYLRSADLIASVEGEVDQSCYERVYQELATVRNMYLDEMSILIVVESWAGADSDDESDVPENCAAPLTYAVA